MPSSRLAGKHILSADQFTPSDLKLIFKVARKLRRKLDKKKKHDKKLKLLRGVIMASLFYEESTRTASSFTAAIKRLGGTSLDITHPQFSSIMKGETLPDTVRTLEKFSDLIVLRHNEVGSAAEAARYLRKPLINAGDGIGEHPTQALLDMFTINEELGDFDGLNIALVGDLLHGRTVHALVKLLSHYKITLTLVSPEELRLPDPLLQMLLAKGVTIRETADLEASIEGADVIYMTRIQKERFKKEDGSLDEERYARVHGVYCLTPELMKRAKQRMIIMHPFPRVNELSTELDADPRFMPFKQIEYGLYVRMALIALVMDAL